jgi:multidrug efflux pump subunit AcrA (membrane-fusion protein)
MERDINEGIRRVLTRGAPRGGGRVRRFATAVAICAVALTGAASLGWQSRLTASAANTEAAKDSRLTVVVIPAQRGKSATELTLPGTVLPIQETVIYARTNGYVKR